MGPELSTACSHLPSGQPTDPDAPSPQELVPKGSADATTTEPPDDSSHLGHSNPELELSCDDAIHESDIANYMRHLGDFVIPHLTAQTDTLKRKFKTLQEENATIQEKSRLLEERIKRLEGGAHATPTENGTAERRAKRRRTNTRRPSVYWQEGGQSVEGSDREEDELTEKELARLVASGGTSPPLWTKEKDLVGMTRAGHPFV